jgi:hypothetical protein
MSIIFAPFGAGPCLMSKAGVLTSETGSSRHEGEGHRGAVPPAARTRIRRFRIFSEAVTTHASPAGRLTGSKVVKQAIAQRPVAQTRAAQRLNMKIRPAFTVLIGYAALFSL